MTELGDKFLAALVGTIRDTRFDIADMRNWRPGWFPTMHSRCLSNLIHDRIWAHLVTLIASNPGTSIKDKGATREIVVGAHLRLRSNATTQVTRSAPTRPEPPSNSGNRAASPPSRGWKRFALRWAIGGTLIPARSEPPCCRFATGKITSSG